MSALSIRGFCTFWIAGALRLIAADSFAVDSTSVDNPLRDIGPSEATSLVIAESEASTGRLTVKMRIDDAKLVQELFASISKPALQPHKHFALGPSKGPYIFLNQKGRVLAAVCFGVFTSPLQGATLLEVKSAKQGFVEVGRLHFSGDHPGFAVPAAPFCKTLKQYFDRFDPAN